MLCHIAKTMINASDLELNERQNKVRKNKKDVGKAVWLLVLHRLSKMMTHLIAFF